MNQLICNGLSCPQPVLITKKYLEENPDADTVSVIVDNQAASENVSRFLENRGFNVSINKLDNCYEISASRIAGHADQCRLNDHTESKKILIMITNDVIGNGEKTLGEKLMLNFLKTLPEMGDSLWRIVFLNKGVKLSVKDSPALPVLTQLEAHGVSLLVCGTCLEYYSLHEKKGVGITTNMLDIVTSLQAAEKIINI